MFHRKSGKNSTAEYEKGRKGSSAAHVSDSGEEHSMKRCVDTPNLFINENIGTVHTSVHHASTALNRLSTLINSQQDRIESIISSIDDGIVQIESDGSPVFRNANGEVYYKALCSCETSSGICPVHSLINEFKRSNHIQMTHHIHNECLHYEIMLKKMTVNSEAGKLFMRIRKFSLANGTAANSAYDMIAPLIKELIAALAHEINNPLTPIIVLSEMDVATLPPPSESPKHLEIIHDAGERIQHVIQQLLSFNQVYHNGKNTRIELNRAVRLMINNIRKDFTRFRIKLNADKNKQPAYIKINDAQFQQIVHFILYNIQSQMRSAGENAAITLSTHEEKNARLLRILIEDIDLPWFFPEDDKYLHNAGNSNFRDIQLILADLLAQLNHITLTFGSNGNGTNEITIRFEENACEEVVVVDEG